MRANYLVMSWFWINLTVLAQSSSSPSPSISLREILHESSLARVRRSSRNSGQSNTHARRHGHGARSNYTTRLNSAVNTTQNGFATVIKEDGKLPRFVCPDGHWACPYPENNLVKCIALTQVCDYRIDCPGGDDEDPVQCAHNRLRQANQVNSGCSCNDLKQRINNLERGYIKHSCEMESLKHNLISHRHPSRNRPVQFPDQMSCGNYGFRHIVLNNNDDR